jgi:membrane-associated phospholipid phosphatase
VKHVRRDLPCFAQKGVSVSVIMDAIIVAVSQYLLYFILAAAAISWLYLSRPDKVGMAAQAIVAVVIMVVLIKFAAAIYTDPRPFVVDTSIKPLFAHPADNGFPSDHSALAATVALLVMMYRRWLGVGLLVASLVLGAARVAAHVHHAPDIAAGVLIAILAVGAASVVWRWVRPQLPQQLTEPPSSGGRTKLAP